MPPRDRLSFAQQESLVAILCYSDEHGRILSSLLAPETLEGDYREIGVRALAYWKKYRQAPRLQTSDLFADILEDGDNPHKAEFYRKTLYSMAMLAEGGLNAEYIISSLQNLTRWRALQSAVLAAAEVLKREVTAENIEAAEQAMRDVIKARIMQFDRGMRLDDDLDPFLAYLERHHAEFTTGIEALDRRGVVPARGEAFLLIGGKGIGKSWLFTNIGKRGLKSGKKVLHITLENSDFETRLRYYQTLWGATRHAPEREDGKVDITSFERDRDDNVVGIDFESSASPRFSFDSPNLRNELESHIEEFGPRIGNLDIKRFPNGTLSIDMFEAYLDRLEQMDGFIPDMVMVDYPKLMKKRSSESKDWRFDLRYNTEELRRIAIERNHALVFVDQLTREGMKASKARSHQVGEDISQIHTADVVLVHSATEAERQRRLCRLFVDHCRGEKDKFTILVSQSYEIGQWVIDSCYMPDNYFDQLDPSRRQAPAAMNSQENDEYEEDERQSSASVMEEE